MKSCQPVNRLAKGGSNACLCRLNRKRLMIWTKSCWMRWIRRNWREQLLETLDQMMTLEPDPDLSEEEYYEWEDRVNILHDMIDAIDARLNS